MTLIENKKKEYIYKKEIIIKKTNSKILNDTHINLK